MAAVIFFGLPLFFPFVPWPLSFVGITSFSAVTLRFFLAGFGGVVEGVAGALAFGGIEEETALDATGEAGELGFAVYVGADFEVELVSAKESVGDVDFDFRQVDGFVVWAGDGEVGGAGAEGAVDYGDGFGVGGLGQGRG